MRLSHVALFVAGFFLAVPVLAQSGGRTARTDLGPPVGASLDGGYCPTSAGSRTYESIQDVRWTVDDDVISIVVDVGIANPDGCVSGEPCDSYDSSPEYVNAWIDWDEDGTWQPREQVLDLALTGYQSINYSGSMTGYGQAVIPPEAYDTPAAVAKALADGDKAMRVTLSWGEDISNPCTSSWTWGDARDTHVTLDDRSYYLSKLTTGAGANPIFEYPDGVVYDIYYPPGCTVIPPLPRRVSILEYPISAPKSRSVTLDVELDACPLNLGDPRIPYTWSIRDEGITGTGTWTDYTGSMTFRTPDRIGTFLLDIRYGQNPQRTVTRRVLVTHAPPVLDAVSGTLAGAQHNEAPKRDWYAKGVQWASGKRTATDALEEVLATEFSFGGSNWSYGYRSGYRTDSWPLLIDGPGLGDCYDFSEVWAVITASLGIPSTYHIETGPRSQGFLTDGSPSLDPGFPGNARRRENGDVESFDRYNFGNHSLRIAEGGYYDATFNGVYSNPQAFIAYGLDPSSESGVLSKSPDGLRVYTSRDTLSGVYNLWGTYDYVLPGDDPFADGVAVANAPRGPNPAGPRRSTGFPAAEGPYVTRVPADPVFTPVDDDGDGLADRLDARVTIETLVDGPHTFHARLLKGDALVSSRPFWVAPLFTTAQIDGPAGLHDLTVSFSGEDIRAFGNDGPYTLRFDYAGGQLVFETPALDHTLFGELDAFVTSTSDEAVDSDGDGEADALVVTATVEARVPTALRLGAALLGPGAPPELLSLVGADSTFVQPGTHTVALRFDGRALRGAGVDGPYIVRTAGPDIALSDHPTAAYSAADFETPYLGFSGSGTDAGIDTDGDGLFDAIRVALDVEADSAGTYLVTATLRTADAAVATVTTLATLAAGQGTLTLDVPGADVRRHTDGGPLTLDVIGYLETAEQNRVLARDIPVGYTTAAYSPGSFEYASALTIEYRETYGESTTDADGDGLFDTLEISPRIWLSETGGVIGVAGLYDAAGRRVATGRGFVLATAGVETPIDLEFDGRLVFGSLTEGPLFIRDLFLYPTGDLDRGVWIEEAGSTSALAYTDFEPAAVVTGRVEHPETGEPDQGRGMRSDLASDAVDAAGTYRLVLLDPAELTVRALHDDAPDLVWNLELDGTSLGEGDQATVTPILGTVTQLDFLADVDITPPVLEAGPTLSVWPPNHGYHALGINDMVLSVIDAEAGDLGTDGVRILRVSSDEPENGSGDGNTFDDIVIAPDARSLEVRRERQGGGNGRVYTVELGAADPAGNVGLVSFQVTVPTSRRKTAIDDGPDAGYTVESGYVFGDADLTAESDKHSDLSLPADVTARAFPNPVSSEVTIAYELPEAGLVRIALHDVLGREVQRLTDGLHEAGEHRVRADLTQLSTGVYIYVMETSSAVRSGRFVVVR